MAARTGHEREDRQKAYEIASNAEKTLLDGSGAFLPLLITAYPPYARHLDALSLHYMLKASLDGVCDALGIDDWRLWPVQIEKAEPVAGGKVVLRIGSAHGSAFAGGTAESRGG